MSYRTERNVTSYSDHDTPAEFATGDDESRSAFDDARDAALADAEELCGALDDLYNEADATKAPAMIALALQVRQVLLAAMAICPRAALAKATQVSEGEG